jgi:hypothetical protein
MHMPVATLHRLSLVADEFGDDEPINSLIRRRGNEAVPEDVVTLDHGPFRTALGFSAGLGHFVFGCAGMLAHHPHERLLRGQMAVDGGDRRIPL